MEDSTKEFYEIYDYYDDNETLCDFSEEGQSHHLIPVLLIPIFVLGLLGNGLVIFSVWQRPKANWRTADVYISNVALANLTFVVTLPLWGVYTALDFHWPFGVALCKLSRYVRMVNMYASVFSLTCLSCYCYLAIVCSSSSRHLRTQVAATASLGGIWLLSGALALPELLISTLSDDDSNRTMCTMDLSLEVSDQHQEWLWIAGLSLSPSILGFLLPFLAMTVFYCLVVCTTLPTPREEDQENRRLLKMTTTMALVYGLCWIVLHIVTILDALFLLNLVPTSCSLLHFLLEAHIYGTGLVCLSSCLNPLLYAFFDPPFRSQCGRLLRVNRAIHSDTTSINSALRAETGPHSRSSEF